MIVKIESKLKEEFRFISNWDRVDEFEDKIKVKITYKEKEYLLEYIITKSYIRYSDSSSLYDLEEDELERAIYNDYKVIEFPYKMSIRERGVFIKKMNKLNYTIIPLETKIYIKLDEDDTFQFKSYMLKTETIEFLTK